MVIKVYLSRISGNKEIKKRQELLLQILTGRKIDYEDIDITDPSNDAQKQFMRANAKPKDGQPVPIPPQIFNEDQYCGDYELFDEANECNELFEFLKLAPPKNVSATEITLSDLNGNMDKENVNDDDLNEQEVPDVGDSVNDDENEADVQDKIVDNDQVIESHTASDEHVEEANEGVQPEDDQAKHDDDQAKDDEDQARDDDQAKDDDNQAKDDDDQAKDDANQAKDDADQAKDDGQKKDDEQ